MLPIAAAALALELVRRKVKKGKKGQKMAPSADVAEEKLVPSYAHLVQGAPEEPPLAIDSDEFKAHVAPKQVDKKDADTPDRWAEAALQSCAARRRRRC